jgi:hypothetical protein
LEYICGNFDQKTTTEHTEYTEKRKTSVLSFRYHSFSFQNPQWAHSYPVISPNGRNLWACLAKYLGITALRLSIPSLFVVIPVCTDILMRTVAPRPLLATCTSEAAEESLGWSFVEKSG